MTAQRVPTSRSEIGRRFAVWLIILVALWAVWKFVIAGSSLAGAVLVPLTAGAISDAIVRIQQHRSRKR